MAKKQSKRKIRKASKPSTFQKKLKEWKEKQGKA